MSELLQLLLLVGCSVPLSAQGNPAAACAGPYAECALAAGGIAELRDMTMLPGEREVRFWVTPDRGSYTRFLRIVQRADTVVASMALLWPGSVRGTSLMTEPCREIVWGPTAGFCFGELPASRDWAEILRQLDSADLASTQSARARSIVCDQTPLPPLVPGGLPVDRLCRIMVHPTTYILEVRTPDTYWRYQLPYDSDAKDPNTQRDARLLRVLRCALQHEVTAQCADTGAP